MEKGRLGEDLISVYKWAVVVGREGGGAKLFSVVLRGRTRSNGHRLNSRQLPLKIRKHFFFFFTVRAIEQRHGLPGEVVASLPLKIFRSYPKVVCEQHALVDPALSIGLD